VVGSRLLDGSRVTTLIRPVDRTLVILKVMLVPVVALALSLPSIMSLSVSSDPTLDGVFLKLVGPMIAVTYLLLLQLDVVDRTLERSIARLRRRVATSCNHEYLTPDHDRGLACRLTPSAFSAPVFDYRDQDGVLKALSNACIDQQPGQFWFIEGESGTGKTRAALRLVHRLVRDPELFELGGRCFLYDFSYSEAIQNELARQLGTSRHDDAVLLVDNFQLVNPRLLKTLTKRFVRDSDAASERLVVFLARESAAWNLSPGQDVRLLAEAKAGKRHRELKGPGSVELATEVSDFDDDAPDLIRALEVEGLASAAQLHLAQVIARNRRLPPEVVDTAHLLAGDASEATPENTRILALLAAVSMHRGAFSRRSLRRAMQVVARESKGQGSVVTLRLALAFRKFQKVGLVPKIHVDTTRFIFHEDIARQCIDQLWGDHTFMPIFLSVGIARLGRLDGDRNAMRAWLVAVEVGDQEALASKFDAALLTGSYQRMRACLERARDRYPFDDSTLLQLGILLDRAGRFSESRALFEEGIELDERSSKDLAVILAASRLEARHQDDCEADLAVLVSHPDPFVAIVGEYWQLHISAHLGAFEPWHLLRLAAAGFESLDGGAGHWRLYSLGRIYFDALRHLYLSGVTDAAAYVSPEYQKLCKRLSEQLPTYEALRILYTEAHLVGHIFLPRVAIFGERIPDGDAAHAGLEREDVETVESLVSATQRLYHQAREEFGFYGDREESYLMAEALNARLIERGADLAALDDALDEYEEFIVDGSQTMLSSYPHFYRFRREIIQYFELVLDPEPDPDGSSAHLHNASGHLDHVLKLDRAVGNRFGELRAELLTLLLRCVETGRALDDTQLVELERRAASGGYGFEQRLLRHLVARNPLSPLELAEIFRFYPFVNQ
jgi:tetratricopeptide (TPR) repeat protein